MVIKLIAAAQIISGLLMSLDYFIPKERIEVFESRVRAGLASILKRLSGEPPSYVILWLIAVIASCHVVSALASSGNQTAFSWYLPEFLLGIIGVMFIPLWWVFGLWLRFLIYCPKGLIAACMFPIFVAATATEIYKLIYAI